MKTYYSNEQVEEDIVNGVLAIEDDIEIAFDGFSIDAGIVCHNIYSKDYARDINARDINAWNINAGNINAWNINARDINARDIKARNINALNINARDINARNIDARNIKAGDISYYAVCFAYENIKCASIAGRRAGHKHFSLDGKITFKDKEVIK